MRTTVFLREKTLHLTKTTNSSKLLNHKPTKGSHPSGKENPSNEPVVRMSGQDEVQIGKK